VTINSTIYELQRQAKKASCCAVNLSLIEHRRDIVKKVKKDNKNCLLSISICTDVKDYGVIESNERKSDFDKCLTEGL